MKLIKLILVGLITASFTTTTVLAGPQFSKRANQSKSTEEKQSEVKRPGWMPYFLIVGATALAFSANDRTDNRQRTGVIGLAALVGYTIYYVKHNDRMEDEVAIAQDEDGTTLISFNRKF